jgi:hypothetical protein
MRERGSDSWAYALSGRNGEIFNVKELPLTPQWLVRCLRKRPDTVGELKSAENWYHLKNAGLKAHALTGCHDEGTLA